MPAEVAIHFSATGTPNDYVPKAIGVALLPAIMLITQLVLTVGTAVDPRPIRRRVRLSRLRRPVFSLSSTFSSSPGTPAIRCHWRACWSPHSSSRRCLSATPSGARSSLSADRQHSGATRRQESSPSPPGGSVSRSRFRDGSLATRKFHFLAALAAHCVHGSLCSPFTIEGLT
ncbi:DUF1648 domain-containing protein [Halomicroarcula sp. GCM10025894]|uniref:DUF1648 domain-containing protein n=1 Tax=Halomicroarcula sp. GCM10025894 TaxID=3252673 RepID=UPI003606ADD2